MKTFFLVLVLTFFGFVKTFGQSEQLFNYTRGLSNSLVNHVFIDNNGLIWVSTQDGLNVFDGNYFGTFDIEQSYINQVYQLDNKDFMVATSKGLFRLDYQEKKFTEIKFYAGCKNIKPFVTKIFEKDGVLFLTTSGFGLFTYQIDKDTIPVYSEYNSLMSTKFLQSVLIDSRNRMWISSFSKEYFVFDKQRNKFNFGELPEDICDFIEDDKGNIFAAGHKNGLAIIHSDNSVEKIKLTGIGEDFPVSSIYLNKDKIFIGTDGLGLQEYNLRTKISRPILSTDVTFDFSKTKIHSITQDIYGNLWLGIYQKGLMLIRKESSIFENFGYNANDPNGIGSNCVGALETVGTDIWVGTEGDGIYIIDVERKVTHLNLKNEYGENVLSNIVSLYNQDNKYMWVGTYNAGFFKLDIPSRKTLKVYHSDCDRISRLISSSDGKLWFTSYGGGVGNFNPSTGEFTMGIVDNPSWANCLAFDRFGNFWMATCDGLWFSDKNLTSSKHYTVDNHYVKDNTVNFVLTDNNNLVWAGTNKGVMILNPTTDDRRYLLENKTISAMVRDTLGFVWISSLDGLYRYDYDNDKLLYFRESDGLLGNEFSRGAGILAPDGMACFGGNMGVTHIKTDNLVDSINVGNILIHRLIVNSKEVRPGDRPGHKAILSKSILETDTIYLHESDNIFTLLFCTSNPAKLGQTTFRYRMIGFDDTFITCSNRNFRAIYTNLESGTYTFEVIANIGTEESEPKRLTIIISPYWYKTVGAKILFGIGILMFIFLVLEFFKESIRRKQSEQINEMKMQFFINISHEIRTPLTLIIDPLEKLLARKNVDPQTNALYKTMQINSRRILRLVSQLLDLRKIDKHQVMMKFGKTELCSFVAEIVESCQPLLESKEITLCMTNNRNNEIYAWIDPENFEKIILNLISNAVKFTPIGGEIDIDIDEQPSNNKIVLSITDNGIGLNPEELEKIFERFYQVKSAQTRYTTGTGVGLHLAKYLTELHKGKLYAENREDKQGSRFVIELQMGCEHLPKSDLIEESTIISTPLKKPLEALPKESIQKNTESKPTRTRSLVFVVDDEESIRQYLQEQFSQHYDVMSFPNGKLALDNVLSEKPDLIISDIMMPEMDGWAFCKKLKRDFHTNHIPVILLTALTDEKSRSLGIEIGADMYMEKPFNTEFLLKVAKNLIENRKKIVDNVTNKAENFNIENIQMKSQDEILMQKVMQIIKDKISDRNLNVEMLADAIGISRVHLHRKIKEITGLTARDFLKNIKMKQASYLLTDKSLTISEIAYAVGYSNPAHFSSSFKAFYGISPLAYSQREKENIPDTGSTDHPNA